MRACRLATRKLIVSLTYVARVSCQNAGQMVGCEYFLLPLSFTMKPSATAITEGCSLELCLYLVCNNMKAVARLTRCAPSSGAMPVYKATKFIGAGLSMIHVKARGCEHAAYKPSMCGLSRIKIQPEFNYTRSKRLVYLISVIAQQIPWKTVVKMYFAFIHAIVVITYSTYKGGCTRCRRDVARAMVCGRLRPCTSSEKVPGRLNGTIGGRVGLYRVLWFGSDHIRR